MVARDMFARDMLALSGVEGGRFGARSPVRGRVPRDPATSPRNRLVGSKMAAPISRRVGPLRSSCGNGCFRPAPRVYRAAPVKNGFPRARHHACGSGEAARKSRAAISARSRRCAATASAGAKDCLAPYHQEQFPRYPFRQTQIAFGEWCGSRPDSADRLAGPSWQRRARRSGALAFDGVADRVRQRRAIDCLCP